MKGKSKPVSKGEAAERICNNLDGRKLKSGAACRRRIVTRPAKARQTPSQLLAKPARHLRREANLTSSPR